MALTMSERKRLAIIQAAIHEFNAAGFSAATMNEIAARAQVSKRTIYNHFENKEALFRTISEQVCESVSRATEMAFDPERSVEDQLTELAKKQIDLVTSKDFLTMIRVTLPARMRSPELADDVFATIRLGDTGLGRWLEQAKQHGALELENPKEAGRCFSAMIFEFAFWPVVTNIAPSPTKAECRRIVTETVNLFLNGCRLRK
ncbi:TetR/AcrR family transcriptional regulator [Roseibacillus persicicus]|uniref:TetR family transcriptional regulator n=1 Tax=Roseibacillus persicicus TaxID=454148 RepID=A0A918TRZ8_9BACT|nr:TetR/AcrR family transcriptional regulator [Roseibacillus persicicus]GHC58354.1 TetR family transcriptional regulator [Roseibacillus persicicus]